MNAVSVIYDYTVCCPAKLPFFFFLVFFNIRCEMKTNNQSQTYEHLPP